MKILDLTKRIVLLLMFFLLFLLLTLSNISFADWEQVNEGGFGDTNNEISSVMSLFDGYLYVGTGSSLLLSAISGLWRSSDGTTWEQVNTDGFGDSNNTVCPSMIVYGEYLYVGTVNISTGCEIWRSSDGTTWDQVNIDGFGDSNNEYSLSMIVYDDYLYAGTGGSSTGCEIWRSSDGTTWEQINTDGFGDSNSKDCYSMIVYDDYLYAGTSNRSTGCELWRYSESPTFTISGSVTGAVSSNVPINLTGTDSQTVKTDSSGNYQFTGLASGDYMITPELEGYTFEPPNREIPLLISDTSGINFVSSVAPLCAPEVIYGENSEQVKLLRTIRDVFLSKTPEGQEIIRLYYNWSPAIVKAMEEDEEFKEDVKEMIDGVLGVVEEEME